MQTDIIFHTVAFENDFPVYGQILNSAYPVVRRKKFTITERIIKMAHNLLESILQLT